MHEIFYETGFAIEITENNTNLTEKVEVIVLLFMINSLI